MYFQMQNTEAHVFLCVLLLASGLILAAGEYHPIGACYGMEGDHLPSPEDVVNMYKSHGIGRMRLYKPNIEVFKCLYGSGIEVVVGIKNDQIKHLMNSHSAEEWIRKYIQPYCSGVHFRYIVVGNEAVGGPYSEYVLIAIQHLTDAIRDSDDIFMLSIKVSTCVSESTVEISYPLSDGTFSSRVLKYMIPIVHHLKRTNTPLLVNIHPYFRFIRDSMLMPSRMGLNPDVALEEGINALREAIDKAGGSGIGIVVSETGWPLVEFPGGKYKTGGQAESYLSYVIKRAISSHPWREGSEIYLYAMFNENKNPNRALEHWGLFSNDKKLILNISFT